jgi:hypothetical protein
MRRTILPAGGSPSPASAPCTRPLVPERPYSGSEMSRAVPGTVDQAGETVTPGPDHARVVHEELSAAGDVRHAPRSWVRRMARELSFDLAGRSDRPGGKPDADCPTALRGAA